MYNYLKEREVCVDVCSFLSGFFFFLPKFQLIIFCFALLWSNE